MSKDFGTFGWSRSEFWEGKLDADGDPYEPTIVARAHPREVRINYSSEGWSTLVRE